ncbi:MAG: phosphate/phosphite/phosphonate ABC transporter substrate-binding protein [Thalassovita sp.]|nr:phosphate/phosphite/phosphonate ABC transporter substrate-binding protein [Thalassovita sp.]
MTFFLRLKTPFSKTARTGLIALLGFVSPVLADQGYSVGVVPQFEARKLADIWTPILEELERRTGAELHMIGSPRIPEFEQAFIRGEFDFAYMNPYHSLVAFEQQHYQPLIRHGERKLFGVLVVRKDSPYQSVQDLSGKKIAFPSPNALGASLLMRADLDRRFHLDFEPDFVNTHASAYLNVVLGEADAGGGVMGTFNSLDPQIRDHLRIIYETTHLPPHPLVVHPRVPKEIAERVQQAFLDMAATPDGQALLARVPIGRAVKAEISDYQELRELKLDEYHIETGIE